MEDLNLSEKCDILICEVCGNSVNLNEYEKHLKNHFKSKRGKFNTKLKSSNF